ncbi:MAG: glycogen debranching protein GlgX [Rectinemataceae bacterium]
MKPAPLPPDAFEVGRGNPLAPGAVPTPGGVDFSVFSRHATGMILCLYRHGSDAAPAQEIRLDPVRNRTGDIWHCRVPGIGPGALYLWRAEGPFRPKEGLRFNPNRVLIDPYAKALADGDWDLAAARAYLPDSADADLSFATERNDAGMPKCVVIDDAFDWRGDTPLNYPLKDCVIYETHVRGLSRGPGARVEHPGSYRGVVETIPYFKRLGVTSLEFLPVQEFDAREPFRRNPLSGRALSNYWGYSTLAFFAPKASYAHVDGVVGRDAKNAEAPADRAGAPGAADGAPHDLHVREFKTMVRELHAAGIEVILDVVFNHSAEGNELGPTLSFRGLDNSIYYMLESDRRRYKNYSGCGNTLNCNHPVTRTLIQECLRYWVVQMHVDGFRFDLGSILGRDASGELLENPPVIESIAEDPLLRDTKIIAEAWDAGGAYQVGAFPGGRWAEWNDRYRDDVRRFWRGDPHGAIHLATRITGSSDLYLRDGRKPFHSINFVTAHDGFTLNDLVTYSTKHNEANGEGNGDGSNANISMNFGVEGPDAPLETLELRNRQVKNFLATLLLSTGTPMLLGGDEFRRSQGGNNNAYCQDNETSWYDWSLVETHADILRFASELVRFRLRHPAFRRHEFFTGEDSDSNDMPDITWFDERGATPDWAALDRRIAARIDGSRTELSSSADDADFFLMFNASDESAAFTVPRHPRGRAWRLVMDTALPSPSDFVSEGEAPLKYQTSYALAPRSMVVLLAGD